MQLRYLGPICALVYITGCTSDHSSQQIPGTLERDRLELIAEADEPIIGIAIREGDVVAAGARLLQLESGVMQARLDQAIAARSVAERRLAELVKGPRVQEITEARAVLDSARSTLSTETNGFERVRDLIGRKLASQSALDQARTRRDSAAARQKQAGARLNLLLEGVRVEVIEQAEAALKQTQATLVELQIRAARYTVTAPRAGQIEAIPYKLGERPPAGAPVIVMLADGAPYARVYVPEPLRVRFTPGALVSVSVDGRAEAYTGVIRFVSAEAAFTPWFALTQQDRSRLSYRAEIDLTEAAARRLPTGIPVQVVLAGARP